MVDKTNQVNSYRRYLVIMVCCTMCLYSLMNIHEYEWTNMSLKSYSINATTIAVSSCDQIIYPEKCLRRDTMQAVGTSNVSFVYSAYHDYQDPGSIKIIGVCYMYMFKIHTHFCQFWYTEGSGTSLTMNFTQAKCSGSENSGQRYSDCSITCRLPDDRKPLTVSIVRGNACSSADNLLKITYIKQKNYTRNFTMCHSALHNNFSDSNGLIQWVELNRILGATNFLIYNFSTAKNVEKVLKYYVKLGIVHVFQWDLPMVLRNGIAVTSIDVHYYAQTSSYNDCLLRSKSVSKFVVISDMDEFIVPHEKSSFTWIDMLKRVPEAGCYYFRHCYFPRPMFDSNHDGRCRISALEVIQRNEHIFRFGPRNKYMARTNKVKFVTIHKAYGSKYYAVDNSVGLLHHYRKGLSNKESQRSRVKDDTVVRKYGRELTERVTEVCSNMVKYN